MADYRNLLIVDDPGPARDPEKIKAMASELKAMFKKRKAAKDNPPIVHITSFAHPDDLGA